MKTICLKGETYSGSYRWERKTSRAILVRDDQVLLSYDLADDIWMLPGGGMEPGEDEASCCVREVAEETGLLIEPSQPLFAIEEYYRDKKYTNTYFLGTIVGKTKQNLTEEEKRIGMEPRWMNLSQILQIFSQYEVYGTRQGIKGGLYLREYTALKEYLKERGGEEKNR